MESVRVGVLPIGGLINVNYSEAGELQIVGGLEAEFIRMLSQGLKKNFTYSMPLDLDPESDPWGSKINGSWTGLVGMAHRDQVDMSLAKISLGLDRSTAAAYSYPYNVDELTFATRIPGILPNAAAFVNPFSTELWICFFLLLFTFPIVVWLLLTRKYRLQFVYLNVFASLFTKPLTIKVVTVRDRLLVSFWILGALVIALSYGALLLAFMTVPLRKPGIRNVPELGKAARTKACQCGTILGTASLEVILKSDNPIISSIGYNINESDITLNPDRLTLLSQLYSKNLVLIASRYDLQNLLRPYAFIAKETFTILPTTLFLSNHFKYKRELNDVILRITAGGLYQKTVRDYTFQRQLESEAFTLEEESGPQQLQIVDLFGTFILLVCGYSLSLMVFLAELMVWHKGKKKKKIKKRH